jgi:hypothetical protein
VEKKWKPGGVGSSEGELRTGRSGEQCRVSNRYYRR